MANNTDDFKNLARRMDELRTEWTFLTSAVNKLTNEYQYVSDNPVERLSFLKKIKDALIDFDKKKEEFDFEIFNLAEQEDIKIQGELAAASYELDE